MKKRILSIILAIAMLFTLCVPTAFAADVKMANYSTTAGVCMLSWSDAEAMEYSVTVYNASTGAVAWSGTTSYNYLYARMIGLVSGTTYYYTVTASGSTTPAQSAEFTYDSSLETVEVIVAGATYDYYNDKLTWTSSGTIAQFKVEVYSADSNSLIRTLYTTNNYISGDEAFQDTGSYYYKVRIVDANGNNVGDTNYWYYCPSDSTYSFSATVKVTFDANGGYFNGDESQTTVTLKVDRNTCLLSEFPTDWFLYGKVLNGFYTSASGGYQIYEDYEFYEDTLLYVHYDDCDHTTSTTSATCEEDAICSVCGMTLSAKGHNYVDGVCTVCGESEASEDEGSDSVTVSDSENSEILSQVIDTNSVESATISIDTTGSAAAGSTGTLTLSSVTSTVSSLTFDGSTTGSSITLSPTTSANITIGETLIGKETTTSGDETNLSGTVLFYGDLSYSSLNVSGATITMNLAVTGTVDPDSVVLLHNGTSGWERLDSSTVTDNGTLTITGTLTGLSPIMVLTVEADAGGTSHTHSYTSEVTAATCTTDGEITYTCAECGDSYTETIPATGHNYDSGVETRAANCAEDGEITYTCSVCGDSYTETILATGEHDYVEDTVIDATCTENMKIGTFCSLCGAEDPNNPAEEIANTALGHDWDGTYHDATCTEDGYILYTCTVCSETYTEIGYEPATGHSYEAVVTQPTCTEGGYTTYTCTACGDSYTADETEALGHNVESDCIYFDWDYGDVTVTVLCSHRCGTVLYSGDADEVKSEYTDPTCTTNGFTTYTATYYNDISNQTYYNTFVITAAGSATGHTWDEGSVTLEATCETPGSITYNCTVCGADYAEEIPATGHSYEAVVTAPTCTEGGYTTYTCSVCGDSYTADETEATGHSYTESYLWDDDFTSCTITLICDSCSSVVQYVSATDDEVTITEVDGLFTVTLIHDGVTYSTSVQTYTVTWVDGDGNEIQVDSRLLEGATLSYTGSTPTKASDNTYSYTFSGWDKTIEAVSGNTTYTATFTASAHNYTASFTWADDLKSATVTLTCSDCDHTVTIDSSDVTIKAVNNLGLVTRTATAEFNGVTYTDSVTTGVSLLVIPADYTSVNLAIARANGLDASNYSNFDTVTVAINSVQWGLNVLNQATVTAYAEAINTAIDNLEAIETVLVEETVEIDEPIEGTDTDTETDDVDVGDNTEAEPETNPTTGLTLALLPMALAIVGAVANKKK